MEPRYNEATQSRPTGTRYTDADILKIDLPAYAQQLREEEGWKSRDRNAITVFKTDHVTMTLMLLCDGAEIIPGSYDGTGIMTLTILEGQLKFTNGDNTIEATPGQVITVHEHIPFTAHAVEETVCLLTMIK